MAPEQVDEALLAGGMRFRIGDHVFEFLAPGQAEEEEEEEEDAGTLIGALPVAAPIPDAEEEYAEQEELTQAGV